ncbi:hypothetical protein OAT16_06700, partial [Prolixibacteraceae bacterium]|nr:hypothetical protein [Prolixibacteraceae bacterium]
DYADKWLHFIHYYGEDLILGKTTLTNGELDAILTNKEAKRQDESIVAKVGGIKEDDIIKVIR